jgi:hypothetical protein
MTRIKYLPCLSLSPVLEKVNSIRFLFLWILATKQLATETGIYYPVNADDRRQRHRRLGNKRGRRLRVERGMT